MNTAAPFFHPLLIQYIRGKLKHLKKESSVLFVSKTALTKPPALKFISVYVSTMSILLQTKTAKLTNSFQKI